MQLLGDSSSYNFCSKVTLTPSSGNYLNISFQVLFDKMSGQGTVFRFAQGFS